MKDSTKFLEPRNHPRNYTNFVLVYGDSLKSAVKKLWHSVLCLERTRDPQILVGTLCRHIL